MTNKIKLGKNYYRELRKLINNAMDDLSGVCVSAIIVTDKGIFKGVNYEDPITNLGICAERNAIFNGVTNGMNEIYEIHILSNLDGIEMCGACRQVASTFTKPSRKVYVYNLKGQRITEVFGHIMPKAILPKKQSKK